MSLPWRRTTSTMQWFKHVDPGHRFELRRADRDRPVERQHRYGDCSERYYCRTIGRHDEPGCWRNDHLRRIWPSDERAHLLHVWRHDCRHSHGLG